MTRRELDLAIRRKGRAVASLTASADPDNVAELRAILTGWLEGERWHPGLWGQFDMIVRLSGEWTIRRTVRP